MTRRIGAIVTLIAMVFLVAFWLVGWAPATKRLHAAHAKVTNADQQMMQLQGQVASLLTAEKKAPIYRTQLGELEQAVPDEPSYASVIDDLTKAAASAEVTLSTVSPSAETAPAGSGPAELELTLSVGGTYPEILSFITDVVQQPRIFVISSVNLSTAGQSAKLSAAINCTVYYADASAPPGSGNTTGATP
jgi:Tfp pilus assembly protein PilO